MDDQLSEKLKNILADPDSLKSILSIASAFGSVNNNNKSKTADILRIGRKTLHRKLEEWDMQ